MANRTDNVFRNIIWGVLEKMVLLLLPFATRTVLIKSMGAQYLGLGSLFSSVLTVLSLSELGFGSAIVFSMYKPIVENDKQQICALLNAFKRIYRVIGIIVGCLGFLLLPFIGYFIKGNPPADINIYILYVIYLINTMISYFMFAYKAALFNAHQRNDLPSKIALIANLFSNIFQIVLLLAFKNYYIYIIVLPITTIITNIANGYLAKKMFPELICKGKISSETARDIKKRVGGLLAFKVYGVVFSSVDVIVISAFLGLVPLAIYNNYHYIQTSIIGFLNIITTSMTASIGNKMVTHSADDNYKDLKKFLFLNAWISSWCAISLFCLYQAFITVWIGEDYLLPFHTMVLMVLLFLIPRITCLTFTYREAAGLWWQDRFRPFIAAIVNLIINLTLVSSIGIDGVIIATIFCSIFINIPWGTYILFKNYFKRSMKEYLSKVFVYFCIACLVGIITYSICCLIPFQGWGGLIIRALLCVIVPNSLFVVIYHRLDEFNYAKELATSFTRKFLKRP